MSTLSLITSALERFGAAEDESITKFSVNNKWAHRGILLWDTQVGGAPEITGQLTIPLNVAANTVVFHAILTARATTGIASFIFEYRIVGDGESLDQATPMESLPGTYSPTLAGRRTAVILDPTNGNFTNSAGKTLQWRFRRTDRALAAPVMVVDLVGRFA